MKKNFVLIDYENVQPDAMDILDKEHFKVIVFVGANQTKVTFDVASALQRMGERAEYVKITGNGPNALDFHIAYYIGKIAEQEPGAYFHIISKDSGFDPLIQHLKSKKILSYRSNNVTDIPIVKAANSTSIEEKLAVIIADLRRRGTSKPRTLNTLSSTIGSLFQKQLPEQESTALLDELQKQGIVAIDGKKIAYSIPE